MIGESILPRKCGQTSFAMSLYILAPLTGPAIGPIAGAWIAEKTTWRWAGFTPYHRHPTELDTDLFPFYDHIKLQVFYSSSIADGLVQVAGFVRLSRL